MRVTNKILKQQFEGKATDEDLHLEVYSTDASQIKGDAKAIVWPENSEDIHKIIRYAHRTNSKITPRGAGTGLAGAAVPDNSIVVDFSKMNQIIKLDTKALTVIVEPGVVLEELNNELAKHNLLFPVITASHKACTIGGMISTNASGMRAVKYGKMEKWVEELEVFDGMGRQFLVKGDNIKEFCGTEGTIGIVSKAKLKIIKKSKMRSLDHFKVETFDELMDVINSLDKNKILALEYIDKVASRISGLGMHYHLYVEYDDDSGQVFNEKDIEKEWNIREGTGIKLSSEGYNIKEDPQIPLENVPKFIDWLERHDIPSFGHIGTGIIHPRFKTNDLIPDMYNLVNELGGQVSGEHGIGIKKKQFLSEDFKEKIARLKAKHDPKNILNPGKLI